MKKYRSGDRAHYTLPKWTKKERGEWAQDIVDSAARGMQYIQSGDCRSAFSVAQHIHGLRSVGISSIAGSDYARAFVNRCLCRGGSLQGTGKHKRR